MHCPRCGVALSLVAAGDAPDADGGVAAPADARAPAGRCPLTGRELQVLRLVARGRGNKQIGAALGIREDTVKNHITSIMAKMTVADRTSAVVHALRRRWIALDETA
jgi:two-component system response regulator DegU